MLILHTDLNQNVHLTSLSLRSLFKLFWNICCALIVRMVGAVGKCGSSNLFCLPKRTLNLFLAGPIYFVSVTVPSPGSDNAPAGVNQNLNFAERFWGNICNRDTRRASLSSA